MTQNKTFAASASGTTEANELKSKSSKSSIGESKYGNGNPG